MRIYRHDSLFTLYDFAQLSGLNLYSVMGASISECDDTLRIGDDCKQWVEYSGLQRLNATSRHILKRTMYDAERMLNNALGWPIGPTYYENEQHALHGLDNIIRLNNDKVRLTGEQEFTEVTFDTITRTFVNSTSWPFDDCVQYELTGVDLEDTCNLFVWEDGLELNMGNRIRPFIAELNGNVLTITVHKALMIRYDYHSTFPEAAGIIRGANMCDPNTFPDEIKVYTRSFSLPSGTLTYKKNNECCTGGTCDACQLPEIPICLEPIDPEHGLFRIKPIMNTSDDPLNPCWQTHNDWKSCCDRHGATHNASCLIDKPVSVCINYLSDCMSCYGDTCIIDDVCDDMKQAILLATLGKMPNICDCPCTGSLIDHYQMDLMTVPKNMRFNNIGDENQFEFGTTRAFVDLYYCMMKFQRELRIDSAVRI